MYCINEKKTETVTCTYNLKRLHSKKIKKVVLYYSKLFVSYDINDSGGIILDWICTLFHLSFSSIHVICHLISLDDWTIVQYFFFITL